MESKASQILNAIDGLKETKREIEAQHANLGVQICTLEARIATLESLLRENVDVKPKSKKSKSDCINLKVDDQNVNEVFFRMERSTRMEKLMLAWCKHRSWKIEKAVFIYHGRVISADKTPQQVKSCMQLFPG
ncbi:hypothetical protein V2J09_017223 [Rumex salicifolius]